MEEKCLVCKQLLCKFGNACDRKETCRFHHISSHSGKELQKVVNHLTKKLEKYLANENRELSSKFSSLNNFLKNCKILIKASDNLQFRYEFIFMLENEITSLQDHSRYYKEIHRIGRLFQNPTLVEMGTTQIRNLLDNNKRSLSDVERWELLRDLYDLERASPSTEDSVLSLLKKRLDFAVTSENLEWQSFSYLGMYSYYFDNGDLESAWNCLEKMLILNGKLNDDWKVRSVFKKMVSTVSKLGPVGSWDVPSVLKRQLEFEKRIGNLQGQGIIINRLIKWHEEKNPVNRTDLLQLAETGIEISRVAKDEKSIMLSLSRKTRIIETYFKGESDDEVFKLLAETLNFAKKLSEVEQECTTLLRISKIIGGLETEGSLSPQNYIEMACDVAEKNNLPILLSISYQNMIDYLYSIEPIEENLILDYIERKLQLALENNDLKTISMTLAQKLTWKSNFDSEDHEGIRDLYQEILSLARDSNNYNQHKLSLIRLIHIHQDEFDADYGEQSSLYDELLQIQEEANDYDRGKTISSYITWLESISSTDSIEKQWNLLLKLFEIGMELDDAHGMSLTTQKMINWKKKYQPHDVDLIWGLLERRLDISTGANDNKSQIMVMNSMITFLEENQPDNQASIWELLMNILEISERRKDKRVTLRKLARCSRMMNFVSPFVVPEEYLDYQGDDPYEILFHFSTLRILGAAEDAELIQKPKYESSFIHSIIRQQLDLYSEGVKVNSHTDGRCLSIRFESIFDLGIQQNNFSSTIHDFSREMINRLDKPIVIDGPNVFHNLDSSQAKIPEFIHWLNLQEQEILIHLSLNSLVEFQFIINEIHEKTDCKFLFAMTPLIVEDVIMLILASETEATIISNDRFKPEKRDYSELISEAVFDNVVPHYVSEDGIFGVKM